jgi:hypothetical protein
MRSDRRLHRFLPVVLVLVACGGREAAPPSAATSDAGDRTSDGGDRTGEAGVVTNGSEGGSPAGEGTSWVELTGAVNTKATCTASAYPYPDPSGLYVELDCADAATGGLMVRFIFGIGVSTKPGDVLSPAGAIVNAGVTNGNQTFYAEGTYADPDDAGTCSITVDSYEPRQRDGLSARFACDGLVNDLPNPPTSIGMIGAIVLAPASAEPPMFDAGVLGGAGIPEAGDGGSSSTCSLTVTGAYDADAVAGAGNVTEFLGPGSPSSVASTGCRVIAGVVEYSVTIQVPTSPVGSATLWGDTWCSPSCGIDYSSASATCTWTAVRDDGVAGGRFVGSFACSDLTAFDGSQIAFSGTVDAVIEPQPIGG